MGGLVCVDDAKARASKLLEVLEKSISKHIAEEAAQSFHKEQIQENTVLKPAVAIQHERQQEYQHKEKELEHLKHLVFQYQGQLPTLD
ncbi:hypothetical protein V6N13_033964 [Hibiscus sabdariffa]|uniref:Uncharacterized protein n=1 Tax=Hibiscus sabdariffa TaxID=183260 RepID=A0ABR2F979_9ROSI